MQVNVRRRSRGTVEERRARKLPVDIPFSNISLGSYRWRQFTIFIGIFCSPYRDVSEATTYTYTTLAGPKSMFKIGI